MRALALVAAAVAGLSGIASAALAQDGICKRDLLVAESLQRVAIDRLEKTGDSEAAKCKVWREHVAAMRRAGAIYGRCLTGPARAAKVSEVEGSAGEFDGLVRRECRGR